MKDAVVIYPEGNPVAGGSFKFYRYSIAEIKRIFVKKEYRGRGLSKILMRELEAKAFGKGYSHPFRRIRSHYFNFPGMGRCRIEWGGWLRDWKFSGKY
ncbi:MAG: GNAT family N-acetyltransferase [Spirochaetales bacterium]|nr:GNAT family N-acetyltransferase [Spirochaetales bacterium]